jgi:CheY-like chemotaxis protein/HPt (histidine-containing phosphotransfer) domain-containing protein
LVLAVCLGSRDEEGMAAQFDGLATKPLKEMGLFEALLAASEGGRERTEIGRPAGAFDGKMGERHPLRILLAEDSQVNQYVMLRMLSRLGYWAEVADNGREAVLALERSEFDVVLMDVMMPDMDGLEATKVIRERFAEDRRPTVVAVTAYASQGDRERFLRAGMDGYICKPVKVEELVAALEDVNPRVEANMGRPGPVRDGAEAATIEAGDARSRTTVGRRSAEVGPGSFLRGMGVEYAAELAEAFSMEGEAMVARMRQAARTGDAEGLGRAAHTLKSSSMDVRAVELSSLCAELESRSRSGVPQDADRAITRVLELFEDARARLRRDLGRPS